LDTSYSGGERRFWPRRSEKGGLQTRKKKGRGKDLTIREQLIIKGDNREPRIYSGGEKGGAGREEDTGILLNVS